MSKIVGSLVEVTAKAGTQIVESGGAKVTRNFILENILAVGKKTGIEAGTAAATKGVGKAATEAAEKLAKEATEKAASEAAEKLAKEAAEKAAKEGAELSKEVIAKAGDDIASPLAKAVDDVGKYGIYNNVKSISSDSLEEGSKRFKTLFDDLSLDKTASKATKEAGDSKIYASAKKFVTENPGYALGGLSVVVLTAFVLGESLRKNKKEFKIISIKSGATGGIVVKYSPPDKLSPKDLITITGSDSTPSIDGEGLTITRIISDNSFEIAGLALNKEGTTGSFVVTTSFSNQLGVTFNSLGETVGSSAGAVASGVGTAAGAAGKGVASGAGSVAQGVFGGLLEGLGIDPKLGNIIWYSIIIIIMLFAFYYVYSWIKYATSSSYVPPPVAAPIAAAPSSYYPQFFGNQQTPVASPQQLPPPSYF